MSDKANRKRASASYLDPTLRAKLPPPLRELRSLSPEFNGESDLLYKANREAMEKTETERRNEQSKHASPKNVEQPQPILKPRGGPAPSASQKGSAWVRNEYQNRMQQLEYDQMMNARSNTRDIKHRRRARE